MTKPHILLVEDDTFLSSIYAQKLEIEGFDVSLATNGEDGLKLARKDHPVLILLDLIMPKMNGFQVLEQLKQDPDTKDIPVLVLSNLGQKEDIERCMGLGAAGYVIKAHALPHETVAKVKEIIQSQQPQGVKASTSKRKGFSVIELVVVLAIIALLAALAAVAFRNARIKTRDATRVEHIRAIVSGLQAAAQEGAFLCDEKGLNACPAGSRVGACTIQKTGCNGQTDVTKNYIRPQDMHDPEWGSAAACSADATMCDYAFLQVADIANFVIGFSTQGDVVAGLKPGQVHTATQQGIEK